MKSCPNCGITWESSKTLPEDLFITGHYENIKECKEAAAYYGWTEENDKRFGVNVIYCKDYREDGRKDRCYLCTNCNYREYVK